MIHLFKVRVFYEDTDSLGRVYHARFLCYVERARTTWVSEQGYCQNSWLKKDKGFVVSTLTSRFLGPAFLYDELEVRTSILNKKRVSLELVQKIYREDKEIVDIRVKLGFCHLTKNTVLTLPF